jgi:hypothetical protein
METGMSAITKLAFLQERTRTIRGVVQTAGERLFGDADQIDRGSL